MICHIFLCNHLKNHFMILKKLKWSFQILNLLSFHKFIYKLNSVVVVITTNCHNNKFNFHNNKFNCHNNKINFQINLWENTTLQIWCERKLKAKELWAKGLAGRMDPIPPINYMHEMKVEIWVVEGSFNMFERGT